MPNTSMMHGRFHRLLGTLVLFFLVSAFLQGDRAGVRVLGLVFAIVVIVGILDIGRDKNALRLALVFGIPVVIVRAIAFSFENEMVLLVSQIVTGIGVFLALIAIYRVVADPGEPVSDRIAGAICVYLLIGFLWSLGYSSIEIVQPGSFRFPEGDLRAVAGALVRGSEHSFVYFSFVTLTTLGYGEITPVTSLSRTLAWMEAAAGVLYIAITIARLVGQSAEVRED